MSAAIGRGAHPWLRGLIGGALHALSLSPGAESVAAGAPVLLQTAALLILLAGLPRQSSPRGAAVLCWVYGTVWLVGATGWMFVSLHLYGGLPAWMAATPRAMAQWVLPVPVPPTRMRLWALSMKAPVASC